MSADHPFEQMTKMWAEITPQFLQAWLTFMEDSLRQSVTFRSQIDQAVATSLKAWGLPTQAEQRAVLAGLERLAAQVEELEAQAARLETARAGSQSESGRAPNKSKNKRGKAT